MLEKSKKRGERRWRTHTKWLSRLKERWNWHGWNWDYNWRYYNYPDRKPRYFWDCTTLDRSFYDVEFRASLKNTPTPCSDRECGNPRRNYKGRKAAELTLQERRAFQPEISNRLRPRRRRKGHHDFKVQCYRCGKLLQVVKALNFGPRPPSQKCNPSCRK